MLKSIKNDGFLWDTTEVSSPNSPDGILIQEVNLGLPLMLITNVDQNNVPADGSVIVTITAEICNYLDEPQTNDTRNITFELDGHTETVAAVGGKASTTFTPGVAGISVFKITAEGCNPAQIEVTAV